MLKGIAATSRMFRAFILVSVSMLIFASVGAVASNDTAADQQVVKEGKLAVFQRMGKTTKTVRLGMLQTDMNELLGKPRAYRSPEGGEYFEYGELYAGFIQNRLVMLTLGEDSYLQYGIKLGMDAADVVKKLGEPSIPNRLVYEYRYDYKKSKAILLSGAKEIERYRGRSDVFSLELAANSYGTVNAIRIVRGDYAVAVQQRAADLDEGAATSNPIGPITMEDLAFVPEGKQASVALGMTRKQAEKIFGKPIDTNLFGIVYDGITVSYRNDQVVSMILRLEDGVKTIYKTPRGAGILMSAESIEALYGKPTRHEAPYLDFMLYMEDKKDSLRILQGNESPLEIDSTKKFFISMLTMETDGPERVNFIMICDSQFAFSSK
jgi:outer membrane protein assembly factor BamE (lipoprotein component of BamABCDE complex)